MEPDVQMNPLHVSHLHPAVDYTAERAEPSVTYLMLELRMFLKPARCFLSH